MKIRFFGLLMAMSVPMTVGAQAKNVILFIGDGMGQDIIDIATMNREKNHPGAKPLALETLFDDGQYALTHVNGLHAVADSASSATAMACGAQTLPEAIGYDRKGKICKTILELARDHGRWTGLVTDTRLSHATPAAFASHVPHRSYENEIVPQLIDSQVNVLLGGGARHFLPAKAKFPEAMAEYGCQASDYGAAGESKRKDTHNYVSEAAANGYTVVCTRGQLHGIGKTVAGDAAPKVLGLFSNSGHPYINDLGISGKRRSVPTVAEMTKAALDVLGKSETGFFLMVEGGQIDWALHDNDAGTALQELLEFDEAVRLGLDFAKKTDTLILVTADHSTGGVGLSYQSTSDEASARGFVPKWVSDREYKTLASFPDLKGDKRYSANEDFLPYTRLKLLGEQRKSFDYLAEPWGKKLSKKEITLKQAVAGVRQDLLQYTPYELTDRQITRALHLEADGESHVYGEECPEYQETADRFYVYRENGRRNILGKLVSPQNGVVFSTGTHVHVPVLTFAAGSAEDAARVRGQMTNADIYGIVKSALGL